MNKYDAHLARNEANYQPLTPLGFLDRAAKVFPDHPAIIHGTDRTTYATFHERCLRLASALSRLGIARGDTVSALFANTPAMLEAHYGVPMTGGVLHSINTRIDAATLAFQLDHAETKVFLVDTEYAALACEALALCTVRPTLIAYDDPQFADAAPEQTTALDAEDYAAFVAGGDAEFDWHGPEDEWDAISLNYTSGTTGNPKGVVYHHRGAHLMGYANVVAAGMPRHPVYLWTLPMFHCNGWCFPWSLSTVAGTHVCLRYVRPKPIFEAIADHRVTHLCGAPIVMATLLNAADEERRAFDHRVSFITAAAPPPEA
ncbi:MAG: AMP-binding protein, partial [Pseudomonadota bacterium]